LRRTVTSKDNDTVRLWGKISSQKKYRAEYGLFPLEGARIITDAVKENAKIKFLIAAKSSEKKFAELISRAEKSNADVIIVPDSLADLLALTKGTQGIFAACGLPEEIPLGKFIAPKKKYAVLHSLQDPGNMGTIIRTADAMGVDGVIAVNCCDIFSPKTVRSTMGSLFRIKFASADEDEIFSVFRENNIKMYAAVVGEKAVSLTDCVFPDGAAVFIGNEGNGLSSETADRCDEKLTIRMNGSVESLNAATAASIIMWELTKQR